MFTGYDRIGIWSSIDILVMYISFLLFFNLHGLFQIEGAFIQGLGWAAMEELKWGDENHKWIRPGHLFTCGPGSYKIPSVNDIPLSFKVSLLKVSFHFFLTI